MTARTLITSLAAAFALRIISLSAPSSKLADAVMKGDKAAVRALLAQKADVNAAQVDGATALHWRYIATTLKQRTSSFEPAPTSKLSHAKASRHCRWQFFKATHKSSNGC